jgi:hypothetical protein
MELSSVEYWLNRLPEKVTVCDETMADGTYWLTIQRKDGEWAVYYKGEDFVKAYVKDKDLGLALTDLWCELVKEGYSEDDYDD